MGEKSIAESLETKKRKEKKGQDKVIGLGLRMVPKKGDKILTFIPKGATYYCDNFVSETTNTCARK
jgi:hypothetical protein